MTEPSILFVKPGAVKSSDKGRLSKLGVCVVEIEHPTDAKLITPSRELSHSALLAAAAAAIIEGASGQTQTAFARSICAAIKAAHGSAR